MNFQVFTTTSLCSYCPVLTLSLVKKDTVLMFNTYMQTQFYNDMYSAILHKLQSWTALLQGKVRSTEANHILIFHMLKDFDSNRTYHRFVTILMYMNAGSL